MDVQAQEQGMAQDTALIGEKRGYQSHQLIQAAALNARHSNALEDAFRANPTAWTSDHFTDHQSYVIGAIYTAIAFLEAMTNEVFSDASYALSVKGTQEVRKGCAIVAPIVSYIFSEEIARKKIELVPLEERDLNAGLLTVGLGAQETLSLARWWNQRNAKGKLVNQWEKLPEKLKQAPKLAGRPALTNEVSYQDVLLLIELRNSLVHPMPASIFPSSRAGASVPMSIYKLIDKLEGKFSLNPLPGGQDSVFPIDHFSHDCTVWAVATVITLARDFFDKLGIGSNFPYDALGPRLETS